MEKMDSDLKINLDVLNKLDYDPEINELLGKYSDKENGPEGENIWPSNMISREGNDFKINEVEFDRQIERIKKTAMEDNDSARILKIKEIAEKKMKILSLIASKLKAMGYRVEQDL